MKWQDRGRHVVGDTAVRPLLALGETSADEGEEWPDYRERFGLGPADCDALIRMATSKALNNADSKSSEVWAPVHAWRVLGQLRAEAATKPLLALLKTLQGDDRADHELPIVFGMIGPAAIQPIAAFLFDRSTPTSSAATAITGLTEIVGRHPACRDECIALLIRTLTPQVGADPSTNGFVLAALLDLKAVEAIDAIREAFRRDAVDPSIAGDVEDAEIELGLRDRRTTPNPHYPSLSSGLFSLHGQSPVPHHATPVRVQQIGRNDPCPCGSGKKYKKCCLQERNPEFRESRWR